MVVSLLSCIASLVVGGPSRSGDVSPITHGDFQRINHGPWRFSPYGIRIGTIRVDITDESWLVDN